LRLAIAVIGALALGGCLPAVDLPDRAAEPRFDPIVFFTGETRGGGALATISGSRSPIEVRSIGRPARGGGLMLDQRIREGAKIRDRQWSIRPLGNGRFTGELTEAVGPVEARVDGNMMTIAYRTADYRVRQRLVLGGDGAVRNRLDIYKWGLNVARLGERIERR